MSVIEDSATFLGLTERDPDVALREARALGADAVRMYISWRRAVAQPGAVHRAGRLQASPTTRSPGYNWGPYDRLVRSRPVQWAEGHRDRRPGHAVVGFAANPNAARIRWRASAGSGWSCYWKPDPKLFGKFVGAVAATRFRGKVSLYSVWNEPNLENYLLPQRRRTKAGVVDMGGKQLRELYIAGYRAIRANDRRRARKVLFGETSAISAPRETLYSALCLNRRGRPYTGAIKRLRGVLEARRSCRSAGWRCTRTTRARWGRCSRPAGRSRRCRWATSAAPPGCSTGAERYGRVPRAAGSTSPSSASSRGPRTPAASARADRRARSTSPTGCSTPTGA